MLFLRYGDKRNRFLPKIFEQHVLKAHYKFLPIISCHTLVPPHHRQVLSRVICRAAIHPRNLDGDEEACKELVLRP